MVNKTEYIFEVAAAKNELVSLFCHNKSDEKSEMAGQILRDKELFSEYVKLRLRKKRNQRIKQNLTIFVKKLFLIKQRIMATIIG